MQILRITRIIIALTAFLVPLANSVPQAHAVTRIVSASPVSGATSTPAQGDANAADNTPDATPMSSNLDEDAGTKSPAVDAEFSHPGTASLRLPWYYWVLGAVVLILGSFAFGVAVAAAGSVAALMDVIATGVIISLPVSAGLLGLLYLARRRVFGR